MRSISLLLALALGACGRPVAPLQIAIPAPVPAERIEVQILAINDFHGNLEPPRQVIEETIGGQSVKVPAGGAAYLAAAAKAQRQGRPYSVTVSAGDMIGASPLVSALFLDEPTIEAMEEVGVEYNAVGNHEFDKGSSELLRMQRGGCEKLTSRTPCAIEPFDGADFRFLAANVQTSGGQTLFPGTAIKNFGPVQLGIIGMTLKETSTLVSPAGVAGLSFADEAATANAAVPALKAAGADAILLLLHQGARTTGGHNDRSCPGLSGDILPILDRLDPAIDLVVSGHTHAAYICDYRRPGTGQPLLLTSGGRYGTFLTDVRLTFGADGRLRGKEADNLIVQSEPFDGRDGRVERAAVLPAYEPDPRTAALVSRYVQAAAPQAARVVGRLSGSVTKEESDDREHSAGHFIADAQLAASRSHGAQIAFINSGGVRTDLVPASGGAVSFGQIFAMQPFGNSLVVMTLTGAQLKALLEQQFASGSNTAERPNMLLPSRGFFFAYDLKRAAGDRIVAMRLNGRPIDPAANYRISVNNFLASGGDNFTVLAQGRDTADAGLDLDALEAWLKPGARVPELGRIENRTR